MLNAEKDTDLKNSFIGSDNELDPTLNDSMGL